MLKGYLADLWLSAMQGNKDNILYLLGSTGQKIRCCLIWGVMMANGQCDAQAI